MAHATMNPIRLTDTYLTCVGEFLIDPGQDMSWLTPLPVSLAHAADSPRDAQIVPTLVMANADSQLRTGVVLHVRLLDPYAAPERCEAAREEAMTVAGRFLTGHGADPVRPLADEGVFTLLPRGGMHFLCRAGSAQGEPAYCAGNPQASLRDAVQQLLSQPGSGLCLTLFSLAATQEPDSADFTLACWGIEGELCAQALRGCQVPVAACPEADPVADDHLTGFEFLYDPWKTAEQLRHLTRDPRLTVTSAGELGLILGEYRSPAASAPAPAFHRMPLGGSTRQMTRSLLEGLPDLRQQMRTTTHGFREGIQQQVQKQVSDAIGGVQQAIGQVSSQLTDLPGLQREQLSGILARLEARIDSLSPREMAAEMDRAGLNRPIDMLTLMKMGFSSEQELLEGGLDPDLLSLLRSAIQLRAQCPAACDPELNCMPYAFMIGYLYEALIGRCFAPHFHRTGGYRKAHHLVDYTRVNWGHCQRLADFPGYRDPAVRRFSAGDWAAWLNLCSAIRLLRNRQHSDGGVTGFINYEEMDAAFNAFFYPGQRNKLTLLRLPAFGASAPAWAKEYKPEVPAEWPGTDVSDPRGSVLRHISGSVSAFTPSLLRVLMSCSVSSGEGDA